MMKMTRKKILGALVLVPLFASLTGCTRDHQFQPVDMWNRTRLKPYEGVGTQDVSTARAMPVGAIARGQLNDNDALYTGKENGKLVTSFPIPVTEATLKRGQERYTIYCAPCHGGLGDGKGVIVDSRLCQAAGLLHGQARFGMRLSDIIMMLLPTVTVQCILMLRACPLKIVGRLRLIFACCSARGHKAKTSGPTIKGGGVYEHLKPC